MSVADDVNQFVGELAPSDSGVGKRKRRNAQAAKAQERPPVVVRPDDDDEEEEDDENEGLGAIDPNEMLRDLPRATDNTKTLASIQSKFKIGSDPEFTVQLHRVLPKYFRGGVQAHGYMAEFKQPIEEEYVNSEYGGGEYQAVVFGPDPKSPPNGRRPYERVNFSIGGPPNEDNVPRSVRAKLDQQSGSNAPAQVSQMMAPQQNAENPSVAQTALKIVSDQATRDREDLRTAETRAEERSRSTREMIEPLIEAEKRVGQEALRAERERSAVEREYLQKRLEEQAEAMRQMVAKVESMEGNRVSAYGEVRELLKEARSDGDAAVRSSENITNSILERNKVEMETMAKGHQSLVESLNRSHADQVASMREAHSKELSVERELARNKEERHQEQLKAEREERRRDSEAYKKQAEDRDQQWRDRLTQQELNLKTQWESRVETQKSTLEARIEWMKSELEQSQSRIRALEAQTADCGDALSQLAKFKETKDAMRDVFGLSEPSSTGMGGIGMPSAESSSGGGAIDWADIFKTGMENLPDILREMKDGGGIGQMMQSMQPGQPQPQPQQPQQPQVGSVVQTPQGPMVIVQGPNGQLGMTPQAAYERAMKQRGLPGGGKQRGILAAPKKKTSDMPVQDMAVGLPDPPWKKKASGEMVQNLNDGPAPGAQQAKPAQQPQQPRPQQPGAPQAQPRPPAQQQGGMDQTQKMIATEVAKLVHTSVENGDDAEEFVARVVKAGYPDVVVQTIAGMSPEQVIAGIKAVAPQSAGATPLGQRFVHSALKALRDSL